MSDTSLEHARQHTQVYWAAGMVLFVLTVATVMASVFHFAVPVAVTIGLLIAVVKGSLVALFFMHLNNERRLIYGALIFTVVFFLALLLLPLGAFLGSYATDPFYVS
jgi:cytochrome c oxidase subunit 4